MSNSPFNPAMFAAPVQPPAQGQVNPMTQPAYPPTGFNQQPQAPAAYPPAGFGAPPQAPAGFGGGNPGASPALNMAALAQALGAATMGATYSQTLPQGNYIAVIDKVDWTGTNASPMCFVEVIVEASDNPAIPPGFRGKLSPIFFGATKYTSAEAAFAKGLAKLGALIGCNTHAELEARVPDWRQQIVQPTFGRGCKLAIQSVFSKNNDKGQPMFNTTAQRVG